MNKGGDSGSAAGGDGAGAAPDHDPSAELLRQEQRLVLPEFDEGVAISLGQLILERAMAEALVITVEVHVKDRLVFRAALPGTGPMNDQYLGGKLRWVQQSGQASLLGSLAHQRELVQSGAGKDARVPEVGPFGGAVPLRTADGQVAGIALVSGLSQEQDHELIVWALERLIAARANSGRSAQPEA